MDKYTFTGTLSKDKATGAQTIDNLTWGMVVAMLLAPYQEDNSTKIDVNIPEKLRDYNIVADIEASDVVLSISDATNADKRTLVAKGDLEYQAKLVEGITRDTTWKVGNTDVLSFTNKIPDGVLVNVTMLKPVKED